MRAEAADLLACLASQPTWVWTTSTLPGGWSKEARDAAGKLVAQSWSVLGLDWRERYAEAEASLREVADAR